MYRFGSLGRSIRAAAAICLAIVSTSSAQDKGVAERPGAWRQLYPGIVRGPYLQTAAPRAMTIRWRTSALDRGVVRYGLHPDSLTERTESQVLTMEHELRLPGLRPARKYFYAVGGDTHILKGDSTHYFITPPEGPDDRKYIFGALGDCGNNSGNQRDVRDQFLKYLGDRYMDAWLLLGDNAYESGTDAEYQRNFFEVYQDAFLKRFPLFPAPGNHDYREIGKYRGQRHASRDLAYFQSFSMPVNGESGGVASGNQAYYSFDIGNVHFLSLDSYGKEGSGQRLFDTLSAQVEWVKKDLEQNRHKQWVVAYWHHPPYSMGSHNSDKEKELVLLRENFIRILERHGVDLVLTGHSHSYERSGLISGHYGSESSFRSELHSLSGSSGRMDGSRNSGPYLKDSRTGKGTVYVVSGSAGKIDSRTQASFPHDAMQFSDAAHGGGLILEVQQNRLDVKWLGADGLIRDHFTMMKDVNRTRTIRAREGEPVTLTASFVADYKWSGTRATTRSLTVVPRRGRHRYSVTDRQGYLKDVFNVIVDK